jgi:DNA-binding transcriptional LysR family regulator
VPAVHERLITLAKARRILSNPGLVQIGCAELLRCGRLVELFPEWSDERFPLYVVYPSRLPRGEGTGIH